LLILPLVNGFHDSLRAVLLSGWQWIAHSSARQRLSPRFARYFARRMTARCSYLRSSTAFTTVCAPFCSTDGSELLILPLVNGFHHGSRAVLSGWQWIAHSSARQRLSPRFTRHIAQRMAVDCSFFHSSTAFTTVRTLFCSADDSALLILPLVNGFHDSLRAVLLSGSQSIAHSSARQWLSPLFARPIAQRMAVDCSFLRSSTAFTTVRAPCSADGRGLLILPLVNSFSGSLHAVLLSG